MCCNDICEWSVEATSGVIPSRNRRVTKFSKPGCMTYVAEKHDAAKEAFLMWMEFGKQKMGHSFTYIDLYILIT
jgi:hypothetical protein